MNKFNTEKSLDKLKEYVNTYDQQAFYKNYDRNTWINDIIYGLGVSIDKKFEMADGYRAFKKELINLLQE